MSSLEGESPDSVSSETPTSQFPGIPAEAFSDDFTTPIPGSTPHADRPRSGEVCEGEPTRAEIYNAAVNAPCKKHLIVFEEQEYPIVDLTNSASDVYVDVFGRMFDELKVAIVPWAMLLMDSFPLLVLFRTNVLGSFREIAQLDDEASLKDAFHKFEIPVTDEEVQAVRKAAKDGRYVEFVWAMIQIVIRLIGAPAKAAFGNVSVAGALQRALGPDLMELVVATLTSSLKRRRIPCVEAELREQLDLMDKFDQVDVVWKQYEHYQESGKVSLFFVRSLGGATRNTGSETPSASTTKTTPSQQSEPS